MSDRQKVINGLEEAKEFIRTRSNGSASKICRLMDVCNAAVILLKEQGEKEQISDAIHETAKPFRRQIVMCKDCRFYPNGDGSTTWLPCREIITPPGWFCADGERRDG